MARAICQQRECRIRGAGFVDVKVEGEGGTRRATARWPRKDATADIPPQITKIVEIKT